MLESVPPDDEAPLVTCHAPCDRPIPLGEYRVRGVDVDPSRRFRLEGRSGDQIAVWARLPDPRKRAFGAQLDVLGAITGTVGLGFFVASYFTYAADNCFLRCYSASDEYLGPLGIGVAVTAVGVGMVVAGVLLRVFNAEARVKQRVLSTASSLTVSF